MGREGIEEFRARELGGPLETLPIGQPRHHHISALGTLLGARR